MSATLYELLYIIDSTLEEGPIQQLSKDVRTIIEEGGGEVLKEANWGKRPLSFPIKKKTEGFYINMDFNGSADIPEKLNEYVFTHAGILRHMTLKVPKAKLLQQKQDEARKEKELQAAREAREEELAAAKAAEERAAAAAAAAEAKAAAEAAESTDAPAESAPAAEAAPTPAAPAEAPAAEQPAAADEPPKSEE